MLKSIPVVIIGVVRSIETTALFVLDVVQIHKEKEVLCPVVSLPSKKKANRKSQATGSSTGNLMKRLSTERFTGQNKLPAEQHCDFCGCCGISSAQSTCLRLIEEIKA